MNIVILDGYTCNPGDLTWACLERFGEVTAYDVTPPELVYERCKDADIIITNKTYIGGEMMKKLPKVRYIGLLSTGCNAVDLPGAAALNIPVTYIPGYSTAAVAQHTFALLLELCNHVGIHANAVKKGQWETSKNFCFWNTPLTELVGKTFGVFGMGSIGQAVAKIADALGMRVVYHSRTKKDLPYEYVTKEELFEISDVLSLHCPLTAETKGLINENTLALMKPTAFLLNTTRGDVVDEAALAQALQAGRLAGAGVDVLCQEPPVNGSPLITAPNTVITPHIAWAAKETRQRLMNIAADNLEGFLKGELRNPAR